MRLRTIKSGFRSNCVCAGSSALMLVYAHVHTELWFLAFIALIPFLSQLCRSGSRDAPVTGFILATVYVLVTCVAEITSAPMVFLFKLLLLNVVFGFLSLAISTIKSRLRFEPLVIALLTIPVSLILVQFVDLEHLFAVMHTGPNLAISFYSLFSILLWSAVIILGNSLVLAFARFVLKKLRCRRNLRTKSILRPLIPTAPTFLFGAYSWSLNPRAPPSACSQTAS